MESSSSERKNSFGTDFEIYEVQKKIILVLLLVIFVIILRRAWIAEDAYITFRTVDNFINGYGLTWNIGERVQTYTHPLWLFLISLFYFITHEAYFTTIFVSLLMSFFAIALIPMKISKSEFGSGIAIIVLMFSNAFVDYSTSGLENPLSYLISGLFLFKYFNNKHTYKDLFILSAIASFAALNRLDSFVIFFPPLLYAFWKTNHKGKALKFLLIGQLPIIIWEIFSIFYYGFLFPNTYYAKLNHMIPWNELLVQGGYYCLESLTNDPITLLSIIGILLIIVISKSLRKNFEILAVIVGVVTYMISIIVSGGDFMAGRFFALPLYIFAILMSRMNFGNSVALRTSLLFFPIFLGLIASPPTYAITGGSTTVNTQGIANERVYYFLENGLVNQSRSKANPFFSWIRFGNYNKDLSKTATEKIIDIRGNIGMAGYYSGPNVHIVDILGLGDPLMARLPAMYNYTWRIGHHERAMPAGYTESISQGKNLIEDNEMRIYYDRLSLITQGDIFDIQRLKTIIKMNLGFYDSMIDIAKYQFLGAAKIKFGDLPQVEIGTKDSTGSVIFPAQGGLAIDLGTKYYNTVLEIGLDSADSELVWIIKDGEIVYKEMVYPTIDEGVQKRIIKLPSDIASQGYDFIRILPATISPHYLGFLNFK
ncbi:MAG: hypothetical protein NTZ74_16740 [Chloroflexi bacterium]|nr:hypothetical protein [Chloroflexota bacterium]